MLNFGNKEFRNLQEQVLENMKNIEKIEDVKIIGVDITYIVATEEEMEAKIKSGEGYERLVITIADGVATAADYEVVEPSK